MAVKQDIETAERFVYFHITVCITLTDQTFSEPHQMLSNFP